MFDEMIVLLIAEDAVRIGAQRALESAGMTVQTVASADAIDMHRQAPRPGIVITDLPPPDFGGLEILCRTKAGDAAPSVIVLTASGDHPMAPDAAYDRLAKPLAARDLVAAVRRALETRNATSPGGAPREPRPGLEGRLIGRSSAMARIRDLITDLAGTSASVLIRGETGTGRELVARCLHESSPAHARNFVPVSCGMPENLVEGELFGYEAGVAGHPKRRGGRIEQARDGTLFLEEIENSPVAVQVKLLRFLQEGRIERYGSNEPISVTCRVLAAMGHGLDPHTREGRFRRDLYYRLNVASIEIPPLRDRPEDIPLLFAHFLRDTALRYGREPPEVPQARMQDLLAYPWPGNVRELQTVASRFLLGLEVAQITALCGSGAEPVSLSERVAHFERCLIEDALRANKGNVATASRCLNVPRKTLYHKINRYGIALDALK